MSSAADALAGPIVTWAQRNRVMGWSVAIVVLAFLAWHVVITRLEFEAQDRKITAIQRLLCLVVDKTRAEVAEACPDPRERTARYSLRLPMRLDSVEIPISIVVEALSPTEVPR